MFCKNCGQLLPDGTVFCTKCGANQTLENTPPQTELNAQPQNTGYEPPYNTAYYPTNPPVKEDKSNVGLNILSWFIPLFGIIYYFVVREKKPKEAKGTLKTALISFGVNFVLAFIGVIITVVATGTLLGVTMSQLPNLDPEYNVDYSDEYNDYHWGSDDENHDHYDYGDEERDDYVAPPAAEDTTAPTTQSDKSDMNASTKWTDYTVYINGVKVTLPMSYADFTKATGCTFKDADDAQSTLKPNYYTYVNMVDKNGNVFCIDVLNDSDSVKTYGECKIININDFERHSLGNADIVFAGGLRIGDKITENKLKEMFGTPDTTWYSDDGKDFKYTYYENYDEYYSNRKFEITVYSGVINDLELTNRS